MADNKGRCKTIPFYNTVISEHLVSLIVITMHVYNAGAFSSDTIGAEENN